MGWILQGVSLQWLSSVEVVRAMVHVVQEFAMVANNYIPSAAWSAIVSLQ